MVYISSDPNANSYNNTNLNPNASSYNNTSLNANSITSYLNEIEKAVASLSLGLSTIESFVGVINGFLPDETNTSANEGGSSTITSRLSALCTDTNGVLSRLNRVNTSLEASLGK